MQTTTSVMTETKKRITLATLKSFIRRNASSLYIKTKSRFDGMTDCVQEVQDQFTIILSENAIGLKGAYLVGGSRNHFWNFEDENFVGIEISNCCGRSIIAVKK